MRNGAKECVGGQASHKPILDNRITRSIRSVCNKPEWHIVQPPFISLHLQSVRCKFIIHWCTWVPNSTVHRYLYWGGDFVQSVGKIFSTGWKYLELPDHPSLDCRYHFCFFTSFKAAGAREREDIVSRNLSMLRWLSCSASKNHSQSYLNAAFTNIAYYFNCWGMIIDQCRILW